MKYFELALKHIDMILWLVIIIYIMWAGLLKDKDSRKDVFVFLEKLVSSKWALISATTIAFFKLLGYFFGEITSCYLGNGVSDSRIRLYNEMLFKSEIILSLLIFCISIVFLCFLKNSKN